MRWVAMGASAVLAFVAGPLRPSATLEAQGDGYAVVPTPTDVSQAAPPGYEGRIEIANRTEAGNTPATAGQRRVRHFEMDNLIKSCPTASGSADGTGLFVVSEDRTDAQATGTSTGHTEMRATAKYHGQVADDGQLHDPITADIDFTYTVSSNVSDRRGGAIATAAGSNPTQHIRVTFSVGKGLASAPDILAFSGGDPTQGHLSDAYSVATALTYWAGVYYGIAQIKWYGGETGPGGMPSSSGQCVHIAFSPPSNTTQPVLGGQVKVSAELKTKGGEPVKARFFEARPAAGAGIVQPAVGASDVGSPMNFTYTAPTTKTKNPGFTVWAISRAGTAEGEWKTGLGTDWSGEITYAFSEQVTVPETDMGGYSTAEQMAFTVTLKEGKGSATSYASKTTHSVARVRALRGGALTLIERQSENGSGEASGPSDAHVLVTVDKNAGTYSILPNWMPVNGKMHEVTCNSGTCETADNPYGAAPALDTGIQGKLQDPDHLSGTKTEHTRVGPNGVGERTWTVTWNLARTGTN